MKLISILPIFFFLGFYNIIDLPKSIISMPNQPHWLSSRMGARAACRLGFAGACMAVAGWLQLLIPWAHVSWMTIHEHMMLLGTRPAKCKEEEHDAPLVCFIMFLTVDENRLMFIEHLLPQKINWNQDDWFQLIDDFLYFLLMWALFMLLLSFFALFLTWFLNWKLRAFTRFFFLKNLKGG